MRNLLLFLLLLLGVWYARRAVQRFVASKRPPPQTVFSPPPSSLPQAETMVPCLHCGVHLPESEALRSDGGFYCCAAHREAGPASGS